MPKKTCEKCNQLITSNNYPTHITKCTGTPTWHIRKKNNLRVRTLTKTASLDWKAIQAFYDNKHTFMDVCRYFNISTGLVARAVKKGLLHTRKAADTARLNNRLGRAQSEESKQRISNSMRKAVLEGRQQTNRPWGKYLKIYKHVSWLGNKEILHGGWELKVAVFLDEKKIKWSKSRTSFTYIWNNRSHEYFPDFYLPDKNCYIEVKGLKTDRDDAKWKYFTEKLYIIDKQSINNLDEYFETHELLS